MRRIYGRSIHELDNYLIRLSAYVFNLLRYSYKAAKTAEEARIAAAAERVRQKVNLHILRAPPHSEFHNQFLCLLLTVT